MTTERVSLFSTVSAAKLFWCFVVLHVVAWTVIPAIVCPNLPLDVVEGYAWGREWVMGTYKHPPMQAWLLELFNLITRHARWSHLLVSQLAIGVTFWAVWNTGKRITTEPKALIGALLLEGVIYYNFASPEFNPNILQLPFWALIGLYFHRAVRDQKLMDWALVGVWSAGGLYTKYSTVLLLGALALLAVVRPETRRCLKTPGPYIAFLIAVVLFGPHMWWLTNNDYMPFTYAQSRIIHPFDMDTIHSLVIAPLLFAGSQVLSVTLGLLLFICLLEKQKPEDVIRDTPLRKFDKQFLITMTFGPAFLVLVMAMCFGLNIHDMWATPFWNFLGLFGVIYLGRQVSQSALLRFQYAWAVVFVSILLIFALAAVVYPYVAQKPQRFHFPGSALAKIVASNWDNRFHTPLVYVGGDTWPAGNIAYYDKQRPHVFINMDTQVSPWVNPDDFAEKGGVVVWCVRACSYGNRRQETPSYVVATPGAEIQQPITLPRQTGADVVPVEIGWAIVPPKNAPTMAAPAVVPAVQ